MWFDKKFSSIPTSCCVPVFLPNERRWNPRQKFKSIRRFAKKGIRRISLACLEANAKIHPVNNAEERGNVKRRIHFLHHSPGRIRIQVDGLKGNAQLGEAIHSLTNKVQGVQRISASTVTGSVLICYDQSDPNVLQYLKSMVNEAETLLDTRITDPIAFAKLLGAYSKEQ